jgi:DNA-binding SARP family transcriptional activator/tetratricopeptide (TPR) repeat protein
MFGPVEVWAGERLLDAGQPRQRSVLAALLVDAGRQVSVATLVERVWGGAAPAGARHALYSHIARVRRMLADADDGSLVRLVRRSGGYQLDVDPDRVDLHRFGRLVERAREPACDDVARAALLREALELWRGEPLAGLPGDWAARVREGWTQRRIDAAVTWAQAQLRLGEPGSAIPVVQDLLGEHPLVEPLAAVLAQALHAAGRTADALDCYARTRRRLVDELGTEPGTQLQAVHQAILRGELAGPAPPRAVAEPVPAAAPTSPAQLPADVPCFTGRVRALAHLDEVYAGSLRQHTAVVTAVISGTAGVGKTTLAVRWAHLVADRFPDGQLYVNLRGFDPARSPTTPGEAVRGFLDALGVAPERIPPGEQAQVGLYRSLLAGRRVLILLDNARDAEQVRPLLPGAAGCMVVVTSRDQLTGLVATEGARPLSLDLLSTAEARDLLAGRLGRTRVDTEPAAVDELIAGCARLPLALAVVAARAVTNDGFPLASLAGELRSARGGLAAFDGGDPGTDVRAVFSWSYRQLGEPAARLFRLLGTHAGPDIGVASAASLAGCPPARARGLLAELARAHLVAEHAPGRFGLHDLLRAYAAELAVAVDTAAERRAALHRVLEHYLHTGQAAALLVKPTKVPLDLDPAPPGVTAERLTTHPQAMAWFTAELRALLAAVQQAAAEGLDEHAWRLAWTLTQFSGRRGRWQELATAQTVALAAARRLGDPVAQAHAHDGLGSAYGWLHDHRRAEEHLRRAGDLFRAAGDRRSQARMLRMTAWVYEQQGRFEEAFAQDEQALLLYQEIGDRNGQADVLNALGWYHGQLGRYGQSLRFCGEALELFRAMGNRPGQAHTSDSLGFAHQHLGHHTEAMIWYARALELFVELGDRVQEATVLTHIGDAWRMVEDAAAASTAWRRALAIFDELGHRNAEDVRAKLCLLDRVDLTVTELAS